MDNSYVQLIIAQIPDDHAWHSRLMRRHLSSHDRLGLIQRCSRDFLESQDASRFAVGLAIRLSRLRPEFHGSRATVHRMNAYTVIQSLHCAIRGYNSENVSPGLAPTSEHGQYFVLHQLAVALLSQSGTFSSAIVELVQTILALHDFPAVLYDCDFLHMYTPLRCSGMVHESALYSILHPWVSTTFFLADTSFLIHQYVSAIPDTLDELTWLRDPIFGVLTTIADVFWLLSEEWLDWKPSDDTSFWGPMNLFSSFGLLETMKRQLSYARYDHRQYMSSFMCIFKFFEMCNQRALSSMLKDIQRLMQSGHLCQRPSAQSGLTPLFLYLRQNLLSSIDHIHQQRRVYSGSEALIAT